MNSVFNLWRDVYATYRGDDERHRLRLLACSITASSIAYFGSDIADTSLEMMAVAVSILTGFTFTALFSSYAATTADLPEAKDETDRENIITLKSLEANFRARSKFLILASMLSLVAMVLLSIEIYPKMTVRWLAGTGSYIDDAVFEYIYSYAALGWRACTFFLKAATIFVFFEAIYTFYRLSETVVAALTLRGEYKESHRG